MTSTIEVHHKPDGVFVTYKMPEEEPQAALEFVRAATALLKPVTLCLIPWHSCTSCNDPKCWKEGGGAFSARTS